MPHPRTIPDARGRPVPIYSLAQRWHSPDPETELPQHIFDDLRARFIDRGFLGLGLPWWMFWLLLALYASLLIALLLLHASQAAIAVLSGLIILAYFAYAVVHKNQLPTPPPDLLSDALLEHRRCPSCAYDLRAASRDDTGAAICPECGAAWILP